MEILDDNCKTKPEINYPTNWEFKIIGKDLQSIKDCITEVMGDKKYSLRDGNRSKTGKFHSLNTICVVKSEEERNKIFKNFSDHPAVKMVI